MFKRKSKVKHVDPEVDEEASGSGSSSTMGWKGPWKPVYDYLSEYGGTPEVYEASVMLGCPATVLNALKKIKPYSKAPLDGVRKHMWLCATAWKAQCDAVKCMEEQLNNMAARLEKMTLVAAEATCSVARNRRQMNKQSPRKMTEKQVRAFVTKVNEQWDPESWDGNIWSDDEGEDWYGEGAASARPVVKRHMVEPQQIFPNQPVQLAHMEMVTEDFSTDEVRHMCEKFQRRDLWSALIKAGVDAELIDGKPTGELRALCKKKGLKVSCLTRFHRGEEVECASDAVTQLAAQLVGMLGPREQRGREVEQEKCVSTERAVSNSSEEEDNDGTDMVYIAKASKKQKKKKDKQRKGERDNTNLANGFYRTFTYIFGMRICMYSCRHLFRCISGISM